MVHRLLCDRSDLFAGGVSHAGVSWMDPSRCRPSDPVNILHIHSLTDEIVNFDGGVAFGQHPGVLQTLRDWADRLGCAGELTETEVTLELDLAVPGRETTIFRYIGCENSAVELWRKSSGKHWPTLQKDGIETDLSNAVVDWLFSHPKAEATP